ncbi:NAD(P)/FAD-dependent oxidoreductase [Mucilaginibacter sp.]|uniref:FAD-dependent oxidoreductase n=1 Tax=Mucilaginibacter sp. TaxID=1882438 RepID=UPI0032636A98
MNNINNKKIAIIGGGPGGLTLARLLQMNGADIKVYERDAHKNARAKGATLDLHEESGLAALDEAGLMEAFWANFRPGADALRIADKHANLLHDDDASPRGDTVRPEIDRGPLQNILLESLLPGTVVWDSQFVNLSAQCDGWNVAFKNGDTIYADLVIAADGATSKLRPYLTPIKPFYAGVTAIEGAVYNSAETIPNMHKLLNGGKVFAFGDAKTLIVSSKGDGSLVFYPGFNCDEHWLSDCGIDFTDKAQVLTWFKTEYKGWDEIWLELFENASGPFFARPQYCMPLDQTWETLPNLTMLGDAAHLMPPYAGEGVNMAMLDALELSQCLLSEDFADTLSAISIYEKQMLVRASETADMTMQSTAALHSDGAVEFMMTVLG